MCGAIRADMGFGGEYPPAGHCFDRRVFLWAGAFLDFDPKPSSPRLFEKTDLAPFECGDPCHSRAAGARKPPVAGGMSQY